HPEIHGEMISNRATCHAARLVLWGRRGAPAAGEHAMFYREEICLPSHTDPMLVYSGDERLSAITGALRNSSVRDLACWMPAAAPARLRRELRGRWDLTAMLSASIAMRRFSNSRGRNTPGLQTCGLSTAI